MKNSNTWEIGRLGTDQIARLYNQKRRMGLREIAKGSELRERRFGRYCARKIFRFNARIRSSGGMPRIRQLYVEEDKTMKEIAETLRINPDRVYESHRLLRSPVKMNAKRNIVFPDLRR
ncbi:MAG: hypothetical protein ABIR33_09395 [Pyrinomonadaceae bacterium]